MISLRRFFLVITGISIFMCIDLYVQSEWLGKWLSAPQVAPQVVNSVKISKLIAKNTH